MANYSTETKKAIAMSEAATNIIKALDPLPASAKRRILWFFSDMVQDPHEDCTFAQLDILKEVATHLGLKLGLKL